MMRLRKSGVLQLGQDYQAKPTDERNGQANWILPFIGPKGPDGSGRVVGDAELIVGQRAQEVVISAAKAGISEVDNCFDPGPTRPVRAVRKYCHIVPGVFTPVLAKHTKNLSLVDILAVGVDRMQRNLDPMRKQVETWKGTRLPDESAKLVIYRAFVEGELDVPKHLARRVHDLYFDPQIEEFAPRTTWSLSNAFTSAFKELDPIPQFRATAKLGAFLESVHAV